MEEKEKIFTEGVENSIPNENKKDFDPIKGYKL